MHGIKSIHQEFLGMQENMKSFDKDLRSSLDKLAPMNLELIWRWLMKKNQNYNTSVLSW